MMWKSEVSKQEFMELKKKLERLENDVVQRRNIHVYKQYPVSTGWVPGMGRPSQQIELLEVVKKILAHLKMELVYVDGKPKTVELKKVAK